MTDAGSWWELGYLFKGDLDGAPVPAGLLIQGSHPSPLPVLPERLEGKERSQEAPYAGFLGGAGARVPARVQPLPRAPGLSGAAEIPGPVGATDGEEVLRGRDARALSP